MDFNNFSLFSLTFSLFLLMDPIGNVPIYISILKDIPQKRQRFIICRELLIALITIALFSFLGEPLLNLLKISNQTVHIAGGVVLFIIAIKLIFPPPQAADESLLHDEDPFIVPLAIPLVAGPAVLAAVMIYSHETSYLLLITAIILAWLATTLILLTAPFLQKILGRRGISACKRLMGLLLILLAIQMFLEGLKQVITN